MSRAERQNRYLPRFAYVFLVVAIQLCLGAGYSWTVFRIPLQQGFHWAYDETAEPFRWLLLVYATGGAVGGLLGDKWGPRVVACLGGIFLAAGCVMGALLGKTPSSMVLAYSLPAGFGMGIAYTPVLALLVKWFPDKRGLMAGIAVMGFGAGAMLSAPAQEMLLGQNPAMFQQTIPSTFMTMAIVFGVVVVGLSLLLTPPPAGWTPKGWRPQPSSAVSKVDLVPKQVLVTWQFYALWMIQFCGTLIGAVAISEAAPYIKGFPPEGAWLTAGASVGAMGLCNGLGRLICGAASEKLGRARTFSIIFAGHFIACALLLATPSGYAQGFLGLCLVGLSFGGGLAVAPATNADFFGAKYVSSNYGIIYTAFAVTGFMGPKVVAEIVKAAGQNTTVWDGYRSVFHFLAGVAVVGFVISLLLRPPKLRV
jgi:OFA family oxalate/formate antiporter-like MFS transporter